MFPADALLVKGAYDMRLRLGLKSRFTIAVFTILFSSAFMPAMSWSAELTRPEAVGTGAMVTSAHSLASLAGMEILRKGGNAFDAAVAVGAAVSVLEPFYSNAGGIGFMTLHVAKTGEVISLDMMGPVPASATEEMFNDKTARELGYKAGVVPGNMGGWIMLLEKYGTMSLAQVFAAAIHYAQDGFPVDPLLANHINRAKGSFGLFPSSTKLFLKDGKGAEEGEIFYQKDLAKTFKRLVAAEKKALQAKKNRKQAIMAAYDLFYKGDIAKEMAAFYKENGGYFTLKDFASFKPVFSPAIHTKYKEYDVYSNAPTSRGGLQTLMNLNLLESFDLKKIGRDTPEYLHLLTEVIKLNNADVYETVTDPKFSKVPVEGMISKKYADERRKLINMEKASPYGLPGKPATFAKANPSSLTLASLNPAATEASYQDDPNTTHFDIVDKAGNAAACTQTIGTFGTKTVVGNTGLIFHNATRPGSFAPDKGHVCSIAAGKLPLANNAACIAKKNGKLFMVWGTPGGEGIGQSQMQVFLNVVEFGMGIQEAVEAPRIQLRAKPDFFKMKDVEISIEMDKRVPKAVQEALIAKENKLIVSKKAFDEGFGGMQGILINQQNGSYTGAGDPRRGGYAIGY
jgi:gamma-glutamyltranspeptidase/glutathione hydrolase